MSALVRITARASRLLPFERLGAAGAVLGFLAGDVLRIRRAHVVAAMRRAGVADAPAAARRMYRDLGRGALELLWLSAAPPATRMSVLDAWVSTSEEATAALDAALARGPVVIGATHTGSWELAGFAAARLVRARGRRIAVVAKRVSSPTWDGFMRRLRESFGAELVDPRGALAAVGDVLRAGGVVVMPIDQVPDAGKHAVVGPFLGAPALLDRAPATVAARFDATLLVTSARRDGTRCTLELLGVEDPEHRPRSARIERTTRRATDALDAFVRAHPSSWLWMHRRWKTREAPQRFGTKNRSSASTS